MSIHNIFLDKSCPGGSPPCNGNGQCDHTTGLCTCNEGNQGSDCSGNYFNLQSTNCTKMSHYTISFLELTCPGDCNNAGICNTSTGQCLCTAGRHGPDCSSKVFLNIILKILQNIPILIFSCLEFDCPEDGTCSSQGICDDTIGSCICDVGFEGNTCKGN